MAASWQTTCACGHDALVTIRGWDPPPAPPLPPRPEARRSYAVPIAVGAAAVLGTALVAGLGYVLYRYADTDHLGVLDDPVVVRAADSACGRMARSVHRAAPGAGASSVAAAAAIREQDAAITAMVAEIRAVGRDRLEGDRPAVDCWPTGRTWLGSVRRTPTSWPAAAVRLSGSRRWTACRCPSGWTRSPSTRTARWPRSCPARRLG
jgi:hypothetical protein